MSEKLNEWQRQTLAIIFILLVDILWVSSSELTQTIFHNASYDHAYFLSYFNTSLFSLYAICFLPLFYHTIKSQYMSRTLPIQQSHCNRNYESIINQHNVHPPRKPSSIFRSSHEIANHCCCITSIPSNKLSIFETLKLSVLFCIVWFSMTYTFNLSLNLTSVASNSIISSMSGPFCLILSRLILGNYRLTIYNILGVIVTVSGSSLIGYLDSYKSIASDHSSSFKGDLLAIISALIYAFYVTGIKFKIGDETKVNIFLFFGFIGILNCLILWPGILILNKAQLEVLVWPSKEIWTLLFINGLLTIFSDYFWAQAILLSNPVVATVGLSCMMPLAIVTDEVFRNIRHGYLYYIGAICVWIGFVLVNVDMSKKIKDKRQQDPAE
eukprot:559577_1